MTLSIEQFCDRYKTCEEGREWALRNCESMDEVWQTAKPEWLIWIATREGVLTDKELRLFAVWCARQVQHLMDDQRSINALDVAELHINGFATNEELTAARAAAYAALAAADAAWAAARYAVWDAADAAKATAYATRAASDAAWAASDAAWAAAADAFRAGAAAWAAADAADAAAAAKATAYAVRAASNAADAADAAMAGNEICVVARECQVEWLRENCKPKLF